MEGNILFWTVHIRYHVFRPGAGRTRQQCNRDKISPADYTYRELCVSRDIAYLGTQWTEDILLIDQNGKHKTSQLWFAILAAVEDDGLRNIHDKQIIACELVFMTDDHNLTRSLSRYIFFNFLMLQLAMIV